MNKTGTIINCQQCKKKFYVAGWALKVRRRFCSKKCWYRYAKKHGIFAKTSNPAFIYRKPEGYILVNNSTHPNRNNKNKIFEHILIMSKILKRPLRKGEITHHINFARDDNRRKNLHLCTSISNHSKMTTSLHKLVKELMHKKIIVFNRKIERYEINEN